MRGFILEAHGFTSLDPRSRNHSPSELDSGKRLIMKERVKERAGKYEKEVD